MKRSGRPSPNPRSSPGLLAFHSSTPDWFFSFLTRLPLLNSRAWGADLRPRSGVEGLPCPPRPVLTQNCLLRDAPTTKEDEIPPFFDNFLPSLKFCFVDFSFSVDVPALKTFVFKWHGFSSPPSTFFPWGTFFVQAPFFSLRCLLPLFSF